MKLLFAVLLLVGLNCHARVITQDKVLPIILGGSWKTKCTIRIDADRKLADLTGCGVLDTAKSFNLYDKDSMYIGVLLAYNSNIEGNHSYINMNVYLSDEVSTKDVRYFTLREPAWKFETNNNAELYEFIKCERKDDKIMHLGYVIFGCYAPYECDKDYYATNEYECEKLPEHAKRLPQVGFECDDEYELLNGECVNVNKCNGTYEWDEKESKWLCHE